MTDGLYDQALLRELRKLFALLYPTEPDQRRLASEAELTVGAIPLTSSAYNNWHQILHHANHNQRVHRLVALAFDEFPDNEPLRAFASGRPPAIVDGASFDWRGPKNGRGLLEQLVSGRRSLVHVAHLALGLERARAVAKVVRHDDATGTGFLIEGDRLVTNHHVLPDVPSAASARAIFNYQKGIHGLDEPVETLTFTPETFFQTSAEDDFTVVSVAGAPNSRFGQVNLRRGAVRPGDLVNVIQHPGGGPKQVALSFDVVAYVDKHRVQYLTDTLPGSSGAPVFDRDWNVVALHHSGGWLAEPGSLDQRVYYRNQGILIDRILNRLTR